MKLHLFLPLFLALVIPSAGAECIISSTGIVNPELLADGEREEAQRCEENAALTFRNPEGIAGVYLIFDREYGYVTLEAENGEEALADTGGILHSFLDAECLFGRCPEEIRVIFSDGAPELAEAAAFPPGELPDWVQKWEKIPDGQTDLLLLSTHGDDEQLFFAGLLPYYGAERGRRIQVAYLTDHRNMTTHRVHEMLNGLWNVGIRDYPVFGPFEDYYTFDMQDAYRFYAAAGHPEEELLAYVVGLLRRCRPSVVVGHDIDGEYGHGMHKLYTDLLRKALDAAPDPERFPELAGQYGTWEVPKTYLHLYPEGQLTMDWDVPLETFGGMTAYEVTRDLGFASHASQQKDFAWYFRGANNAADVERYNPCRYGLYRTTVGEDTGENDFFENLRPLILPTEPETIPPETLAPTEPIPAAVTGRPADKTWIYVPAAGTIALAVLTACLAAPEAKEKT